MQFIFLLIGKENEIEKHTILDGALKQIESNYSRGSIVKLGNILNMNIKYFRSILLILDIIIWGGYSKGFVIEIYSPESSSKTMVVLHTISSVQEAGDIAAFVDIEHVLDLVYTSKIGIDIDNLLIL